MTRTLGAALAAALLFLGACAQAPEPAPVAAAAAPETYRPGCYTVDLFDAPEIADGSGLAPAQAAWLGHWTGGAWAGRWCHEVVVTEVSPQGEVVLLDMHGPSEEFASPATVFRRKGRIHEDGSLRFVHGTVVRHYELRGGEVHGWREGDGFGRLEARMIRAGVVPVPRPRPVRLALN